MNKEEMIKALQKLPDGTEVVILDGFNGGGQPITINFGVSLQPIKNEFYSYNTADIETKRGSIALIGYGCY